jgi:hypothetical protein
MRCEALNLLLVLELHDIEFFLIAAVHIFALRSVEFAIANLNITHREEISKLVLDKERAELRGVLCK